LTLLADVVDASQRVGEVSSRRAKTARMRRMSQMSVPMPKIIGA